MLDFLSYLAEWAEGVPLLLLCTARPELFESTGTWGAGTRNAHTINLSPLSEQETSELVQGLLEQTVAEQVRETILERAGGNPLYAEEFVRLVADRGLGDSGDGLAFPESVQALIAAQAGHALAERKALLQDAAVLGKVFWAGALAAMGEQWMSVTSSSRSTSSLARSWCDRRVGARWRARASTRSGTCSFATSRTGRSLGRREPGSIGPLQRGWRQRPGNAWSDLADVLAYHYEEALDWHVRQVTKRLPRASCCSTLGGCSSSRVIALRRWTSRRPTSFYRGALTLYDAGRPGTGAACS